MEGEQQGLEQVVDGQSSDTGVEDFSKPEVFKDYVEKKMPAPVRDAWVADRARLQHDRDLTKREADELRAKVAELEGRQTPTRQSHSSGNGVDDQTSDSELRDAVLEAQEYVQECFASGKKINVKTDPIIKRGQLAKDLLDDRKVSIRARKEAENVIRELGNHSQALEKRPLEILQIAQDGRGKLAGGNHHLTELEQQLLFFEGGAQYYAKRERKGDSHKEIMEDWEDKVRVKIAKLSAKEEEAKKQGYQETPTNRGPRVSPQEQAKEEAKYEEKGRSMVRRLGLA